jgi:hypothetical protein
MHFRLPRHANLWLKPYVWDRLVHHVRRPPIRKIWLAVTDHYEPFFGQASREIALERVHQWQREWPRIAELSPRDSSGRKPVYSFFYPEEQYDEQILDILAEFARAGIGDVEVHIHHDREGRHNFIDRMSVFLERLGRHGLLRREDGKTRFGFIHGNWALDNSLPEGRWCGLNDEISILRDLGCYADFTFPSGASYSQPRTVNSIYWCVDDPQRPKSYDSGIIAKRGEWERGDLLLIQGPLGLRAGRRFLPRMETGEIAGYDLANSTRVASWFDLAPRIDDQAFLKIYTHGAAERNLVPLLYEHGLATLFEAATQEARKRSIEIAFVSAREMYQAIRSTCVPGWSKQGTLNAALRR